MSRSLLVEEPPDPTDVLPLNVSEFSELFFHSLRSFRDFLKMSHYLWLEPLLFCVCSLREFDFQENMHCECMDTEEVSVTADGTHCVVLRREVEPASAEEKKTAATAIQKQCVLNWRELQCILNVPCCFCIRGVMLGKPVTDRDLGTLLSNFFKNPSQVLCKHLVSCLLSSWVYRISLPFFCRSFCKLV